MFSEQDLLEATKTFFAAFAEDSNSLFLLQYFSTTKPVIIQHAPATCPRPQTSRLAGIAAVRSYFDLLSTYFSRSKVQLQELPQVDVEARRVELEASAVWKWKTSGRSWTEDFSWALEYDEKLKITSFIVTTTSEPTTCAMRAVDRAPVTHTKVVLPVNYQGSLVKLVE
ncbi:hypothetical protein CPB83DRAFT_846037 [Crepidotus variabilis]|uniref:SnoaL-like domain-containing protein n=1 Tax=Crepidotus variabilis TaxID=179855 RepID=A0A9P6ENS7_9AGAR|nr:hypothetical protein CPB83DRAFT_846037 [Crepidotus variabilis]